MTASRASLNNLADEELEVTNYAKQKPEIVARLREFHDEWAKDVMPK